MAERSNQNTKREVLDFLNSLEATLGTDTNKSQTDNSTGVDSQLLKSGAGISESSSDVGNPGFKSVPARTKAGSNTLQSAPKTTYTPFTPSVKPTQNGAGANLAVSSKSIVNTSSDPFPESKRTPSVTPSTIIPTPAIQDGIPNSVKVPPTSSSMNISPARSIPSSSPATLQQLKSSPAATLQTSIAFQPTPSVPLPSVTAIPSQGRPPPTTGSFTSSPSRGSPIGGPPNTKSDKANATSPAKQTGIVPAFNPALAAKVAPPPSKSEANNETDGWSWTSIIGKASNAVTAAATTIGNNQGLRDLYANVTPELEKIAHYAENISSTIAPPAEPTRYNNIIVYACLDGTKSMEVECRKVCREMLTDEGYPPANGQPLTGMINLQMVEDVPKMCNTMEEAFIHAEVTTIKK